jgi:uncharacterized lipoprotein NlpE involved in copper resistance
MKIITVFSILALFSLAGCQNRVRATAERAQIAAIGAKARAEVAEVDASSMSDSEKKMKNKEIGERVAREIGPLREKIHDIEAP